MKEMKRKILLFLLVMLCGVLGYSPIRKTYAMGIGQEAAQNGAPQSIERVLPPALEQGIPGEEDADVIISEEIEERLDSYLSTEQTVITSIVSSELNPPQYWSLDIDGMTLTVVFHDDDAADGIRTMVSVVDVSDTTLSNKWGSMKNHESTLTIDLSSATTYPDGTYKVMLWQGVALDNYVWSLTFYRMKIEEGTISFVDPAFGTQEMAFIADLNANYDPEKYNQVPQKYYPYINSYYSADNVEEMIAKAKELTADCTTDEEKVRIIHDWVCLNFSYDYEAYYNGDISDAADAEWVFENQRGVCSGFARMCQVLFTAVGVPCMNVVGYSDGGSGGLSLEDASEDSNHEWNVVYVNGSWRNMDITWDCQNRYLGKYSGQTASNGVSYGETTTGNAPAYIYYGIPSFNMGGSHISRELYMDSTSDSYVASLSFLQTPTKKKFALGDSFSCNGVLCYKLSNGKEYLLGISGKETTYCSGYDMSKNGYQTVTISYCGKTVSYDILVGSSTHVHTEGQWEIVVEATCGTDGLRQIQCTDCKEVLQEEIIPATGEHNYGDAVIEVEPGCTTKGEAKYICTVCGCEKTEELEAAGHKGGVATCTEQAVCEVCGQHYGVVAAHIYSEWIIDKEATDKTTGSRHKECTVCHEILVTETLAVIEASESSETGTGSPEGSEVLTEENPATKVEESVGADTSGKTEDSTEADTPGKAEDSTEVDTSVKIEDSVEAKESSIAENAEDIDDTTDLESSDDIEISVGTEYTVGKLSYMITSDDNNRRTVTCMGLDASVNAGKVTSVAIPSVVKIGSVAYTVTAIAPKAFYKCKRLAKITIPSTVAVIGSKAFYGCKKLTTITIKTKKLTTKNVGSKAFKGIAPKAVIKVPKSKVKAYKNLLKKKGVPSKARIKKA